VLWFYLLSGLFLGWSLGANDAANVFGTAVGTRMVRFRTAAIVASLFVLLGAVIGGAGTTHTLGKLGAVNALAGSFTVALSAALTVTWMTRLSLPVSTSQAIVGAIIGWNLFTGTPTDFTSLLAILGTWVMCPILAAIFAIILFALTRLWVTNTRTHLLRIDMRTRVGLIIAGALGSWALGANNIANVVGVFVPAFTMRKATLMPGLKLDTAQQLFMLGALAIGLGIFTYSRQTMQTVGRSIFKLTPLAALVVVLSETLVLFLFASEGLERWLALHGLPTLPLVPISSSQAAVGAVLGIGLARGARGVDFKVLRDISAGWVSTPLAAAVLCYVSLFFVQNVFEQQVVRPERFEVSPAVIRHLRHEGIDPLNLPALMGQQFESVPDFRRAIFNSQGLRAESKMHRIFAAARIHPTQVDSTLAWRELPSEGFRREELEGIARLSGRSFLHDWQLDEALAEASWAWKPRTGRGAEVLNKELRRKLARLHHLFELRDATDE